jgi:hypothetical protein
MLLGQPRVISRKNFDRDPSIRSMGAYVNKKVKKQRAAGGPYSLSFASQTVAEEPKPSLW